jgi:hypothetical protein
MKLTEVMDSLKCEYGLRGACKAVFFGAQQQLLKAAATVEGITRSINVLSEKYPDRAQRIRDSGRYQEALARMDEAANHAATMHGIIESRFAMPPAFEPPEFKLAGEDQLKQMAEFADCSVEELIASKIAAAEKKFQQRSMAQQLASAAFYGAEAAEDCEVKASTILRSLKKSMLFAREWDNTDSTLATMGLLRADIDLLETLVEKEELQPTHTGCEALEAEAAAAEERRQAEAEKRDAKRAKGKKQHA